MLMIEEGTFTFYFLLHILLPRNFPAVLIIFTGRGGAGNPPPSPQCGAGWGTPPPGGEGSPQCGASIPAMHTAVHSAHARVCAAYIHLMVFLF